MKETAGPNMRVAWQMSVIAVFLVAANAQGFGPQQVLSSSTDAPRSVFGADLDGDGDLDALCASSNDDKLTWFENLGQGSFGGQQLIANVNGAWGVDAADLDQDGDVDVLAASNTDGRISWFENLGAGVFAPEVVISNNAQAARTVLTADIDGDGDLDVMSASKGDDKVAWYENLGGSFGPQVVITTQAAGVERCFAADLDGDGDVDALSADEDANRISWYENLGAGVFGPQQVITTATNAPSSVTAADLDGDGDVDVLSTSTNDDEVAWYDNTPSGFVRHIITTGIDMPAFVDPVDVDSDGDPDLIVCAWSDRIAWIENSGAGVFEPWQTVTTSVDHCGVTHCADLDGDGDPDLISASRNDDKVAWYENLVPLVAPAAATTFGAGCGAQPLQLQPVLAQRPVIGTVAAALAYGAPTSLGGVSMGLSDQLLAGQSVLPLDLTTIGMPGCDLLQSNEAFLAATPFTAGSLLFEHTIPWSGALVGMRVYLQAFVVAPGANQLGVVASNGVEWLIGAK